MELWNQACLLWGDPVITSFGWPGNSSTSSALASLCFSECTLSALRNTKLFWPQLHLQHRFSHVSPPLSACLLILTAQGFVTLPLLFTLFFCLSLPHSVLSFHVLSSHPSSQSSFISRISLPQPPQPEMSQSLASCPPTLTKQR